MSDGDVQRLRLENRMEDVADEDVLNSSGSLIPDSDFVPDSDYIPNDSDFVTTDTDGDDLDKTTMENTSKNSLQAIAGKTAEPSRTGRSPLLGKSSQHRSYSGVADEDDDDDSLVIPKTPKLSWYQSAMARIERLSRKTCAAIWLSVVFVVLAVVVVIIYTNMDMDVQIKAINDATADDYNRTITLEVPFRLFNRNFHTLRFHRLDAEVVSFYLLSSSGSEVSVVIPAKSIQSVPPYPSTASPILFNRGKDLVVGLELQTSSSSSSSSLYSENPHRRVDDEYETLRRGLLSPSVIRFKGVFVFKSWINTHTSSIPFDILYSSSDPLLPN